MPETTRGTDPDPPDTHPGADSGPQEPRLWQVTIAMIATPAKNEELMDRLTDVLCPDPNHEGPCPVPWAMCGTDGDSLPDEERSALLRQIKETNWDPEDDPEAHQGREQERGGPDQPQ